MASTLSRRQQARNEKALQELVQNVPGNSMCADCHARNPSWASWSLGVFLCMRCAAIHRKLGTHISKVKSLSMDSWTNEQVDNMRKVGNTVSNKVYNPEGKRAPVPVDVDEVDSAMERFIRQKYMNNTVTGDRQPQSPRSDEGIPPPLPPKNSSKFGLRSASSLFPLTSRSKKDKALPALDVRRPSSHGSNKPSQLIGASVNFDEDNETTIKLARLRDMGFGDQQRNTIVLRGVNGNLERAIESLIRLGEGDGRVSLSATTAREPTLRTSRSMTPLSTDGSGTPSVGLSLQGRSNRDLPPTPSSTSTNPFDALNVAQPQTAQSTGNLQNHQGNQSWNPFDVSRKQSDPPGAAFQRLDINAAQQQPLFPNRTGGLTPQTQNPPPPFPEHMMPSAANPPQVFQQSVAYSQIQAQAQPQLQTQPTGYNPFLSNSSAPTQQPSLTLNMPQAQSPRHFANNPFARSPTRIASPTSLGRIPEQSQSSFQATSPLYSPVSNTNPFFASPAQTPTYGGQMSMPQMQQMQQSQQQQQTYLQPRLHDKASIMALYNNMQMPQQIQPQVALSSPTQPLQTQTPNDFHFAQSAQMQPQATQLPAQQPVRSMTEPVPQTVHMNNNNNNPFTNGSAVSSPTTDPFKTARKISRESVNLGMDLAWTNGRHSPDAFASLSARHR